MWTHAGRLVAALTAYRAYAMVRPTRVKSVRGWAAVVTGAAGALGAAMARELAARGVATLVLWDLHAGELEELGAGLKRAHPNLVVHVRVVNLADRAAVYAGAEHALRVCDGKVDLVVNNAGVVAGKLLLENSDEFDRLTFDVNALAHVWTAKAFLPAFERRGAGHFCNVSSMASFVATAGMVVYASTKYAARGFAEGLAHELRHRKSDVKVTCVCPSQFQSKLFDGFFVLGNLAMTAEYVAYRAVEGVECERELVVLPQYLIPALVGMAVAQANGYLNLHGDASNPMQAWKGGEHASRAFDGMRGAARL